MLERSKISAALRADYDTYRDFDMDDRERRKAERERHMNRRVKNRVRMAFLNGEDR